MFHSRNLPGLDFGLSSLLSETSENTLRRTFLCRLIELRCVMPSAEDNYSDWGCGWLRTRAAVSK